MSSRKSSDFFPLLQENQSYHSVHQETLTCGPYREKKSPRAKWPHAILASSPLEIAAAARLSSTLQVEATKRTRTRAAKKKREREIRRRQRDGGDDPVREGEADLRQPREPHGGGIRETFIRSPGIGISNFVASIRFCFCIYPVLDFEALRSFLFVFKSGVCAVRRWTWDSAMAASRGAPCRAVLPPVSR